LSKKDFFWRSIFAANRANGGEWVLTERASGAGTVLENIQGRSLARPTLGWMMESHWDSEKGRQEQAPETFFRSRRRRSPRRPNHFVRYPAEEEGGIGLRQVLGPVTVQTFVRRDSTMIAAAVQGDVDGIAKGSHF
jgi:hypothetical protein